MEDDFRQELFLILSEKNPDDLNRMADAGELLSYACRIALNMTRKGSRFYKAYRQEIPEGYAIQDKNEKIPSPDLTKLNKPKRIIDKMLCGGKEECHRAIIFQHFIEFGSIKTTSMFFNIPVHYVSKVINEIRHELRKAID